MRAGGYRCTGLSRHHAMWPWSLAVAPHTSRSCLSMSRAISTAALNISSSTERHHGCTAAAQVCGPFGHQRAPALQQVTSGIYAASTASATVCAKARSMTAWGALVLSAAQSRKADRKPWTVARSASPQSRKTFVSVMSESGEPRLRGDGKTSPLSPHNGAASCSTAKAAFAEAAAKVARGQFAPVEKRRARRPMDQHPSDLRLPDHWQDVPRPYHTGPLSPHAVAPNPPNSRERASCPAVPTGRIPCV